MRGNSALEGKIRHLRAKSYRDDTVVYGFFHVQKDSAKIKVIGPDIEFMSWASRNNVHMNHLVSFCNGRNIFFGINVHELRNVSAMQQAIMMSRILALPNKISNGIPSLRNNRFYVVWVS